MEFTAVTHIDTFEAENAAAAIEEIAEGLESLGWTVDVDDFDVDDYPEHVDVSVTGINRDGLNEYVLYRASK